MDTATQSLRKGPRFLRTLFAGFVSLAILLSCFHGSACADEIRSALPSTVVAEQSQPAPHPVAQHQLADHCLSHLVGDLGHPAATVLASVVKVKLTWRDEANRPLASADSPFKPPRV
jgi:hypothetical protein